ncbi:MAG TPA: ribonuclease PH [Candidatus Polarisedimenticolia bacterium]|jgi:ribonuclease PH|nr:ribonuclease PH [Candidatus Polarisedimenticolia bacterium]
MLRKDGRGPNQMREIRIELGVNKYAEGSAQIVLGDTKVICTASQEDRVPQWLRGQGHGWITAEYGMLPRSTDVRTQREASRGRPSGRTQEIQRLIGRSLRAVTQLSAIGERTIWIDCDVIQADGGTRTASITGGFVALALAFRKMRDRDQLLKKPLNGLVAATSVGILEGTPSLDLSYEEDSRADVDMNIVRTSAQKYVEVQGTAEKTPFTPEEMQKMLQLANDGIDRLFERQRSLLSDFLPSLLQ